MKIALASAPVRNGDTAHNLTQMAQYIWKAKEQGAELVCFGEAYLQGFDALTWEFEEDRTTAASVHSPVFQIIAGWTKDTGVDVMFGFLERDGDTIYSSCALVAGGELIHRYRRISRGWKEFTKTDGHYREGTEVSVFEYRGRTCLIALCGDLWDCTERFKQGQEILFWPVYIEYTKKEWENGEQQAYAQKAAEVGGQVLMINPVDADAHGGSCRFEHGTVKDALPMDTTDILILEL